MYYATINLRRDSLKRRLILTVITIILSGCSISCPAQPDANVNLNHSKPLADNQKNTETGHLPVCEYSSIRTTENSKLYIEILDGKVIITQLDSNESYELEGIHHAQSLAWHTDCGGSDDFIVVTEDGTAYYCTVQGSGVNSVIVPSLIETDEKILSAAVYDNRTPTSTCGGDTFYLNTESGKVRGIGRRKEESGTDSYYLADELNHPYDDWIILNPLFTNVGLNSDNLLLFHYEDSTLHFGRIDQNENVQLESEPLTDEEGNLLLIKTFYTVLNNNTDEIQEILLIDNNDLLYYSRNETLGKEIKFIQFSDEPATSINKTIIDGTSMIQHIQFRLGSSKIIEYGNKEEITDIIIDEMRTPALIQLGQ